MSIVFGFLGIQAQQITPDSPAEAADHANSESCEFNGQNYHAVPVSKSTWWDFPLLRILASFFSTTSDNTASTTSTDDILNRYAVSPSTHDDDFSSFTVVNDADFTSSSTLDVDDDRTRDLTSAVNLGNLNQTDTKAPDISVEAITRSGPPVSRGAFSDYYDGNNRKTRFNADVNVRHISNTEILEESTAENNSSLIWLNSDDQPVSNLNDKSYSSRFAKSPEAKIKSTNKKDVTLNPVHRRRYTEEQMDVIRQGWNQYVPSDAEKVIALLSPKHVSSHTLASDDMQQEEDMDIRPDVSSQSNNNAKYMSNKRLDAIMSTVFDMGFNPEYDKESGIVTVGAKLTFEQRAPTAKGIVMWELVKGTK